MKHTTYDEFVDLARRGTFVPVVKEIMADLLTPVSAFLKIAEHSDYAFLFESVEGGEQVARYSFLGKDPFLVLRSRDGKTVIDRSGVTTETSEPFVPALRRLMAEPGRTQPGQSWKLEAGSRKRGAKTKPASCCSTRCWRSITSSTGS